MNFSGMNFGVQPFATPCTNFQTQLPLQTNVPCQPINQPVNVSAGLSMPISYGTIPSEGRYYVPYPQAYLQSTPNVQSMPTFGQQQTSVVTQPLPQIPIQNSQSTNNQSFGQNDTQQQSMSVESLNAINNYPNSNSQISTMQPNQIQT